MKKLIYLLMIMSLAIFLSCEEDDDGNSDNSGDSYRIKEILENEEGTEHKTVFTYENENLILMIRYHKGIDDFNWTERNKTEISYNDNKITVVTKQFYYDYDTWEIQDDFIYTIENGLIKSLVGHYYDNECNLSYEYTDSKLVGIKAGEFYLTKFNYQNNLIKEILYYTSDSVNNRFVYSKGIYTQVDNKLSKCDWYDLNENNEWENSDKAEFYYTGEKISKTTWYDWLSYSNTYRKQDDTYYEYNSDGLLIEKNQVTGGGTSYTYTYSYESGKGNAKTIYYGAEGNVNSGFPIQFE